MYTSKTLSFLLTLSSINSLTSPLFLIVEAVALRLKTRFGQVFQAWCKVIMATICLNMQLKVLVKTKHMILAHLAVHFENVHVESSKNKLATSVDTIAIPKSETMAHSTHSLH